MNNVKVTGSTGYGDIMARRRFQAGQVKRRGSVWIFRWRDYVRDLEGREKAVRRSEIFTTVDECPTLRLALRHPFIAKKQLEINNGGARVDMTFAQFAPIYEQKILSQFKPSTRANNATTIKSRLVPYFGDMRLDDITLEQVQSYVSAAKGLAPKTIKNHVKLLAAMLHIAKAWGYISHEPCKGVILPKGPKKEVRYFTLDEMRTIIKEAKEPMKLFFWIAAETGMRAGEICGLRWEDINFDKGIVQVRQSAWGGRIGTPKSAAAMRQFSISSYLNASLHEARRKKDGDSELLFHTSSGRPVEVGFVRKCHLAPLLKRLGIERGGLHAFRHGNATVMDQLSVPSRVRQSRLGHTELDVTMGYTHAVSKDDLAFSEELGGKLAQ